MVIDVHVHLSSPDLAADRTPFLAGEPGLAALYSSPEAKLTGTAQLLADMEAGGVDRSLVMGFPFSKEDNARRHADWLLEECAKYPTKLIPLAAFDPRAPWAVGFSEKFLEAGGRGLGELCVYDEGISPRMLDSCEALASACRRHDTPMLVHVNESIGHAYPGKAPMLMTEIMELVRRCQGTKLILAHFGGGLPLLSCLKREVREYLDLVRFDTAAMPFIFDPKALRVGIDLMGADRFFFGSDYPLLKRKRYQKFFSDALLTGEETDLVSGGAARRYLFD
jgi:predicted TIM-barrel fold metal-dependent hydrolase